jgi:hypothetical protein
MSRSVRLFLFSFALTVIAACVGCSHKPAYSEIDANRTSRNQNQNAETQASSQPPAVAEAPPASAPQASPSQTETVKPPAFMTATGTIKDLPSYPRAVRVNVQFGPVQQATVMTLVLHTRDSMEKVQAYYTQAIKENKWTVTDKLLDPELSQWTLNKDERNNAKVEVKKDLKTGSLEIAIVRAEKFETPK